MQIENNKLYKKMKAEWEELKSAQSSVDDKIRTQLDMLDQINNSTLADLSAEASSGALQQQMRALMRKQQQTAQGQAEVRAEYISRGEPFMDI